ncbi:FHA domain-containing protein [Planctomicrobium piriforme]|uniref:FHA domain-containing protein n=1 Tax=Planctomicrobium piriforme TaxID=1576369 RepID=A0A1I3DN34_9PLAN|nr:FHA domain-containing protein [Planctomicrobium piriforme]SFH88135.1 FHA domain-containing protein [Planctomicrobium piriforme]
MKMVLVPLDGGPTVVLDRAILFFGRGPECDIVLTSSRKVSRKHCCIAQIDDRFVVRDLGSMNGMRVNDTVVTSEAPIGEGDVLWVGDVGFRLAPHGQTPPKATAVKATGMKAAAPRQAPPVSQHMVSSEFPVAIPDVDGGFSSGRTGGQQIIPDDEIVELNDSDILE